MSSHARDILALSLLALVVRTVAALVVDWPPYTDPAYYHLVAAQLAEGHGFTVPVIWSFLEVGSRIPADPILPVASNGHWMPMTSIIAAGSMAIFGTSWQAGQIPMVLLGASLVPATYAIGRWLFDSRFVGLVGGLLALVAGPLLIMYPTVDNFAVFGVAGTAALVAATRATRQPRRGPWLIVSGALVGLATLARIDGILLASATATAWLMTLPRPALRSALLRHVGLGVVSAVACVAVLGPWFARNLGEYGTILPSTGGHAVWISTYNEQFSIGHPVDVTSYLASGIGNILGSKALAIAELAARAAGLMGGIFAVFLVVGSWSFRRRPELRPFLVYFWVMFTVMALVFTFHAPKGAFYHSAPAWLPFALPLSVAAIPVFGRAAGKWWPFLRRPATHRFIAVVGLMGAFILSVVGSVTLLDQWQVSRERDERAAAFLAANGEPSDVVMTTDAPSIHYFSGNPAVGVPFDPFPVIAQVIGAYDVEWVIVQRPGPGEPDPLGMWEGAASSDSEGNAPTFLPAEPEYDSDNLRIYRVTRPTP
ncbi:MAG: glycosyltransferase family 39 protein [Candidatus Limnocylindria bacterium]